jgi:glutamyl-tRNA synthetase
MRNYLIRLGWSYKNQEIFSLKEMIKLFNLKKIQKSSAHNNFDKLNWLNRYYVKKLNETDLLSIYKDFLKYNNVKSDTLDCKLSKILNLQKHRFNNFYEIMNNSKFFYYNFDFNIDMQYNDLVEKNKMYINKILTQFNSLSLWKKDYICDIIEKLIKENSIEKKIFFKFFCDQVYFINQIFFFTKNSLMTKIFFPPKIL